MTCVAIGKAMLCLGGPDHRIVIDGKTYVFEWHRYFGPLWLKRNGDHRATLPPQRFYEATTLWHQQGQHLDEDGLCSLVWKPRTKVKRVGRKIVALPNDAAVWDDTVEL